MSTVLSVFLLWFEPRIVCAVLFTCWNHLDFPPPPLRLCGERQLQHHTSANDQDHRLFFASNDRSIRLGRVQKIVKTWCHHIPLFKSNTRRETRDVVITWDKGKPLHYWEGDIWQLLTFFPQNNRQWYSIKITWLIVNCLEMLQLILLILNDVWPLAVIYSIWCNWRQICTNARVLLLWII